MALYPTLLSPVLSCPRTLSKPNYFPRFFANMLQTSSRHFARNGPNYSIIIFYTPLIPIITRLEKETIQPLLLILLIFILLLLFTIILTLVRCFFFT